MSERRLYFHVDERAIARRRGFDRRLFVVAFVIGSIGIVGYLPTLLATGQSPAVLGVFGVLMLVGAVLGARFARPVGLGLPIVERYFDEEPVRGRTVSTLARMVPLGVLVGGYVAVLREFVLAPLYLADLGVDLAAEELSVPLWAQLVGQPLVGGCTEEIVWRFGLMSVVVWAVVRLTRPGERPGVIAAWTGIVVSTAGFSLFHLGPLTTYGSLTLSVILTTLAANATLGVVLGWLYWKRGLEAGIVVHVTTNVVAILVHQFVF